MSNLNEFLRELSEAKKIKKSQEEEANKNLGDFLSVVAEAKAQDPKQQLLKEVKKRTRQDIEGLFGQLKEAAPATSEIEIIGEHMFKDGKFVEEQLLTEVVVPEVKPAADQVPMDQINKYLKQNASFQQPDPDPVDPNMRAVQDKLKFLEQAIGRIAATGPGSGEVNLRWLDDVDRASITDGRYLRYDDATKKFVFDEINTQEVVYNTTYVTTPEYTVVPGDYYIGIDYAGPVTVTLPVTSGSGRTIIIKDEDGDAENNPITVLGTVDNDPNGFVLAISNGAIQLIYRNGWRII